MVDCTLRAASASTFLANATCCFLRRTSGEGGGTAGECLHALGLEQQLRGFLPAIGHFFAALGAMGNTRRRGRPTTNLKKPVPGQSRQRTLGGSKSGDESWHREPPPAARTGAACQSLVCMRRRRRTRRRRRRSFRRYNWIPFYSGFRGQKSPHESKKSWRI